MGFFNILSTSVILRWFVAIRWAEDLNIQLFLICKSGAEFFLGNSVYNLLKLFSES